ncbi:MAG: PQQ-binding-like beta-propeller repeat protein, partial [Verrucomicrobiota bacterium]
VDDKLFFSCDGANDPFVIALNKSDGREAWRTRRTTRPKRTFSFCTPTLLETGAGRWIISPGSGGVFAYDPVSGREVWKVRYGEGYSVVPKPVFGHGMIFVSSGFDDPVLMAIIPGGKGDMTDKSIVWEVDKRAPLTPSKLLIGDELYYIADNGVMTCAEAKTGKTHWQERVCGSISASPVFAEGRIYVQDEKGLGVVVKAGRTFEVMAENHLKERSLASYAVADGALYIRTHENLYRIGK